MKAPGLKERVVINSLKVLPQHTMSAMAGSVFGLTTPKPLRKLAVTAYGKVFGVNFDEVKEPLDSFSSLQDFFVRELKDGARPIDAAADAVVSPCDGAWGACGTIDVCT